MNFFISGEVNAAVGKDFMNLVREIDKKLLPLKQKNYGEAVEKIDIIPIVVLITPEYEHFYKERKLFSKKNKDADIRLRIDYEKFLNGDIETRRILILKNIIDSIRIVGMKAKKDFDAITLEKDVLEIFDLSPKEWSEISSKLENKEEVFVSQEESEESTDDDLKSVVIQYKVDDFGNENDLDKKDDIQDLLDECLIAAGIGNCDGSDIGSGTMNIFCYVVDADIASGIIVNALTEKGLIAGALIFEANEEENRLLWPVDYVGKIDYL